MSPRNGNNRRKKKEGAQWKVRRRGTAPQCRGFDIVSYVYEKDEVEEKILPIENRAPRKPLIYHLVRKKST